MRTHTHKQKQGPGPTQPECRWLSMAELNPVRTFPFVYLSPFVLDEAKRNPLTCEWLVAWRSTVVMW